MQIKDILEMMQTGVELNVGIIKLFIAALLGGFIGWERERRGRPAGLRTHILVSVGVTLMMLVSLYLFDKYQGESGNPALRIDPGRIAAQVITGIGFLGAGTIMRFRATVRGLTTAASLWVVAGIGLAVGIGYIIPAVFTTFIVLITLIFLPSVEEEIKRDRYKTLKMWINGTGHYLEVLKDIIRTYSVELRQYKFENDLEKKIVMYDVNLKLRSEDQTLKISDDLVSRIKELQRFAWE